MPGIGNEWFVYNYVTRKSSDVVKFMQDNYPPGFSYEDFAPMFMQGRAVRSRAVG